MVGMPVPYMQCEIFACASYGASNCCLQRQLDHTTIIEDESLFWLQTSVQAFYTKAIEPQLHRTQSWRLSITVLVNGLFYLRSSTITHNYSEAHAH